MKLLKLFAAFFKIGAFTFGGGYAMIPLMKREVVEKQNWIKDREFLDIIAVTQALPGAVSVNTSIHLGYKVAGIKGAVIAAVGVTLPSFLCILIIAAFFNYFRRWQIINSVFKGINSIVVALIITAAFQLAKSLQWNIVNTVICFTTVLMVGFFDLHPILVLLGVLPVSMLVKHLKNKRESRQKQR